MLNNISCCEPCDHKNIDDTCMFGMSKELIEWAKSNKPMCETLRKQVIDFVNKGT